MITGDPLLGCHGQNRKEEACLSTMKDRFLLAGPSGLEGSQSVKP
jgi:hypothetical protein